VISVKNLWFKFRPYIAVIKTYNWKAYTLYSDNETRVAKIANAYLDEYDKVGNPISERSINLKMTVVMLIRSFSTPLEPQSMEQ
jgi:hypothetical protein